MKVGIYARVSTKLQARDEKTSLDEQVRLCRRWAKDNDAKVVEVYRDPGVSGSLLERPELGRAILDAKDRRFDTLVVLDLNRLARDVYVQETIVRDLAKSDVSIASVNQPNTGDDPSSRLIRQIFGAIAEYDRAMITWRMKLGRDAVRRQRGFCEGQPRYGFAKKDGKVEPRPDEQAVVAVIKKLRGEGRTLREICAELEARKLRPRRGQRWHPNSVRQILNHKNRPYPAKSGS